MGHLKKYIGCLKNDLIIARLNNTYGFYRGALSLIFTYLDEKKQRVNANGRTTRITFGALSIQ